MNKQYITWKQIDEIVDKFDVCKNGHIVTLYRGGLPLGVMLSNRYNIPLSILDYQSYDGNSKEVDFIKNSNVTSNETIYLVDDIADTGNSIQKALDYLYKNFPYNKIVIYTIVGKNTNPRKWNYSIEYRNWVVFPWEENIKIECKSINKGELNV